MIEEKTLKDFIFIENSIPKDLCENIISYTSDKEYHQHGYGLYNGEITNNGEKELEVLYPELLEEHPLVDELTRISVTTAQNYLTNIYSHDDLCSFQLNGLSKIRFNKYEQGTEMRAHQDHIHTLFDGTVKGIPTLSLVGLLNDDFDGGEFCFYNKPLALKQGDILIFPSLFMYPHNVTEVTKGVRHSFVSWFY